MPPPRRQRERCSAQIPGGHLAPSAHHPRQMLSLHPGRQPHTPVRVRRQTVGCPTGHSARRLSSTLHFVPSTINTCPGETSPASGTSRGAGGAGPWHVATGVSRRPCPLQSRPRGWRRSIEGTPGSPSQAPPRQPRPPSRRLYADLHPWPRRIAPTVEVSKGVWDGCPPAGSACISSRPALVASTWRTAAHYQGAPRRALRVNRTQ
jgi:hypothetical protein